jgi:5-methylcytosine-specific restriction protein A
MYERQRKAQADKRRGTSTERGYNNEWRKARDIHLTNEPLCRECLKVNKFIPANVVDHIYDHKGDKQIFWDKTNWQSLCTSCHSKKTVRDNGAYGNKIAGKI